jgi:hypothetical protein
MPLFPELEQIRREIDAINAQAKGLCDGLSEQQLAWRPRPNSWSIAENLIHLETTTAVMLPAVDEAIADARKRNLYGEGPFHLGLLGRLYVWYSEPPPKIKFPAPRQLKPLLTAPAVQACPAFLASQQQMVARLGQANGLDLSRVRFQSPIAAYICMNLLALFSVFTAHERRHMMQIAALRLQLR